MLHDRHAYSRHQSALCEYHVLNHVSLHFAHACFNYVQNKHTVVQKSLKLIINMINFTHQGCIKLIKGDSKNTFNVTKDLYFK